MEDFAIINGGVMHYIGQESHIVIPDGVTKISNGAFFRCEKVQSVVIPNSVTSIGNYAFKGCVNLTNIEIPNSVTEIGDGALEECKSLTSIKIPNGVTKISNWMFADCTSLMHIKNLNTVTSIGCMAFWSCTNLPTIEIPNNVSYIDRWAFEFVKKVKPQYNANGSLRAFKAFNSDWYCRSFHYEVGKSYHKDGAIICCVNGFHACPNPLDVFTYYYGDLSKLRFAEVELSGKIDWGDDKVAASDIKIVRELTASELAEICNSMDKA